MNSTSLQLDNSHALDMVIKKDNSYYAFDFNMDEKAVSLHSDILGKGEVGTVYSINEGVSMCEGNFKTNDSSTAIIHNPFAPTISVSLCFLFSGTLNFGLDKKPEHIFENGYNFIDLGKDISTINELSKNSNIRSLDFHFSEDTFTEYYNQLLEAEIVTFPLERYAYNIDIKSFNTFLTNAPLLMIINQIKNSPYSGKANNLYLEAKIFELLIVYFDNINKLLKNHKYIEVKNICRYKEKMEFLKEILNQPNNPSLKSISRQIGMSETNMQLKFKAYTGKTIIQYHREQVLLNALQMIQANLPIKEVAYFSGYSSTASFSKAFKKFIGLSPSEVLA